MERNSGIYSILNKKNGKIYVGLTKNLSDRKKEHFGRLKRNQHINDHLQSAFNHYGADSFEFNVLEYCDEDSLKDNEEWWVAYFDSSNREKGYNLTEGGDSNPMENPLTVKKAMNNRRSYDGENNPFYGKKHTSESKKKMSEAVSGENSYWYGRNRTDENKLNVSKSSNTTGYFRVCKVKKPKCKQGFMWEYKYYDDDKKRHTLSSVSIDTLKEKVLEIGEIWHEFGGD